MEMLNLGSLSLACLRLCICGLMSSDSVCDDSGVEDFAIKGMGFAGCALSP